MIHHDQILILGRHNTKMKTDCPEKGVRVIEQTETERGSSHTRTHARTRAETHGKRVRDRYIYIHIYTFLCTWRDTLEEREKRARRKRDTR